jgi:hypothetical protein
LRFDGYLADEWFQHAHVLLVDSLRPGRILEPRGRRSGGRRHQLCNDLGEYDAGRSYRPSPGSGLYRLGHVSRPLSRGHRLLLHSGQHGHTGTGSRFRQPGRDCCPGLHHLVRLLLWRVGGQHRLDVHGLLPHGSPRHGHHVAHLLLLGLQHHRELHISFDDEGYDSQWRIRLLRCHLRHRLGVDHLFLSGSQRSDLGGDRRSVPAWLRRKVRKTVEEGQEGGDQGENEESREANPCWTLGMVGLELQGKNESMDSSRYHLPRQGEVPILSTSRLWFAMGILLGVNCFQSSPRIIILMSQRIAGWSSTISTWKVIPKYTG